MSGAVFPLRDNQLEAVNPRDNVWLSASAGTGKTQVLSARVLRLLLRKDVKPSEILCLTFTKAGAAEMANRINAVLARWVRLDDTQLFEELGFLGADQSVETRERARTLFASVLDCPGGGLRIDTIHAFSQWLLANFPEEADLAPGARPMEDRDRELLAREVLADLLAEAEQVGDAALLDAVSMFTLRKDPGELRAWLMRCAGHPEMWEGPDGWHPPMRARVHRLLDMPAEADEDWANEGLHPEFFPDAELRAMLGPLEDWGTKTADKCLTFMREWLTLGVAERVDAMAGFRGTVLKADGTPSLQLKKPRESDPSFGAAQDLIADAIAMVEERRTLLDLASLLTSSLETGRAFSLRWEEAKLREGLLDFTDLIRKAAQLLTGGTASEWIRYKLDRQFDHILIDEAQDTNQEQWDIVDALIDDFFSGDGASGDKLRTIFTVGDYKQAIFGFQGTSPENYARARETIRQRVLDAREHAAGTRDGRLIPNWRDLDLGRSFRSSAPVLDFVNRAISSLGHRTFGLEEMPKPHIGADRSGQVTLWKPVLAATETYDNEDRDWLPSQETLLAAKIAVQVKSWVHGSEPIILEKGDNPRRAGPGDIMVLVRKRAALAPQIVAELHARGVPVAGVDRLRLGAPLAVRDLMAALRFAAQPLDDLSLANLLTSPLGSWSQDDLLQFAPRNAKAPLWEHLRSHENPFVRDTRERLGQLLARADFETPQSLLAWLLTGPWQGRAKLVARLGREANDPIDELVNAAFAYESAHVPSLAGFIEWFDASTQDLKREADDAGGQVQVLTVHGSKGLQAPIVILADATGKPGEGGAPELEDAPVGGGAARKVPIPALKKEERVGPIEIASDARAQGDLQEHWRLLYVAMTRAEEALFIGGALGSRDTDGPHEDSWYARLEPLFESEEMADPIWGVRRDFGEPSSKAPIAEESAGGERLSNLPDWATRPIGPEPRPPRPLAPSSAAEELSPDPPLPVDAARTAARRGVLIHRLLERLPDLLADRREDAARAWIERQADDLDETVRGEILSNALAVLAQPDFADVFSPDAIAEVPLAATIDGVVVSGTVDRLLVERDLVTIVDFKTTRRPPRDATEIPAATLRQMAAYAAALEVIYPGRDLKVAVLYTQVPVLLEISPELLRPHKQRLGEAQESYAPQHIE